MRMREAAHTHHAHDGLMCRHRGSTVSLRVGLQNETRTSGGISRTRHMPVRPPLVCPVVQCDSCCTAGACAAASRCPCPSFQDVLAAGRQPMQRSGAPCLQFLGHTGEGMARAQATLPCAPPLPPRQARPTHSTSVASIPRTAMPMGVFSCTYICRSCVRAKEKTSALSVLLPLPLEPAAAPRAADAKRRP